MPKFIHGLQLSKRFYEEAVYPILEKYYPGLKYSVARLGHGSEILGFDDGRSTDHHWGLWLQLFLPEADYLRYSSDIKAVLSRELPYEFMGYPTNFEAPDDDGVRHTKKIDKGSIDHGVEILTVTSFVKHLLDFDPYADIKVKDWLTFPQQELLCITGGEVFFDDTGELNSIRKKLAYFPEDIWLYLVACQWQRISQEEAFVGRCGEVGDEVGSRIIASRLVRDLMKLCFLLEKTYFPYSKWFGTAFSRLKCSPDLTLVFTLVLNARTWRAREKWLSRAYEYVANLHNSLGITRPVEVKISPYFSRPFIVIHADRFVKATLESIKDLEVKAIKTLTGSVDQFSDNTDFLTDPRIFRRVKDIF
jgi:hypothetical protein